MQPCLDWAAAAVWRRTTSIRHSSSTSVQRNADFTTTADFSLAAGAMNAVNRLILIFLSLLQARPPFPLFVGERSLPDPGP